MIEQTVEGVVLQDKLIILHHSAKVIDSLYYTLLTKN